MPDDALDNLEPVPDEGEAEPLAQPDAVAEPQAAPDEGITAGGEAGSEAEPLSEDERTELINLRKLRGKMGNELGDARKRLGETPEEPAAEEDPMDLFPESAPEAETPEEQPNAPFGQAALDAILSGDSMAFQNVLVALSAQTADVRLGAREKAHEQMLKQRETCISVYGRDMVDAHEAKTREFMARAQGRLGYSVACKLATEGARLKAAEERGRQNALEAAGTQSGRAMLGGKPTSEPKATDYASAARAAIRTATSPNTAGGDFDALNPKRS